MKFRCALCAAMLFAGLSGAVSADEAGKAEETVEVKLEALTLQLPKSWAKSDVVNRMRLATYEIPAVKGDKDKAELAVSFFNGNGGGIAPNISRWVGQFSPEGRESVVRKGKAGDHEYYVVEVSGTYMKSVGPPVLGKTEPVKGSRMLGVIWVENEDALYFLKLTGPDATVKAQAEAMRKAIGGDIEKEEDYEL